MAGEELNAQELFELGLAYHEAGEEAYQRRELEQAEQCFTLAS